MTTECSSKHSCAGKKTSLKRRISGKLSGEIVESKQNRKPDYSNSHRVFVKSHSISTPGSYQTIEETIQNEEKKMAPQIATCHQFVSDERHPTRNGCRKQSLIKKMSSILSHNSWPGSKPSFWRPGPVPKPDTHFWLRWNILWFLIFCVGIIPLPIWLFPLNCYSGFLALCVSNVWMSLYLLLVLTRASYTIWRMLRARVFGTYLQFYPKTKEATELFHVVIMCAYKEPLDLIQRTLESLKAQTVADRLFVVVAFEESTPELEQKTQAVHRICADVFLRVMVTVHPRGVPGEIPGKCSNVNFAAREAVKAIEKLNLYQPENTTLTSCDTDNLFPSRYFEFLGYDFYRRSDRLECVWQAPLLYNYNLHQRPFFVRVTGMLRGVLTMGALISDDINTMSVTSLSLSLLEKGFFHPAYQMDDIIFVLTRMVSLGKRVPIYPILFPVISGPTSGETYKEEFMEWARQARRWTIGAAEVFHYFCVKFQKFTLSSGISYGIRFTHYYGFVLCAMSLFNFIGFVASLVYTSSGVCDVPDFYSLNDAYLWLIPVSGTVLSFVYYAWILLINRLGVRVANIEEPFSLWHTFIDWLLFPLVLLGYSIVEFYAITEVGLLGKKSCKHDASNKDALAVAENSPV